MRLYLKNNEELKSEMVFVSKDAYKVAGCYITNLDGVPYIDIDEDVILLDTISFLSKLMLKATVVVFPKYKAHRELGTYSYGDATAELTPAQNAPYCLRIETSLWEGISDMKILQEKLWAGTIAPTISYEREQKKQNPLHVLAQILDFKKLTKLQRFIFALRLTKVKTINC
jgi:hypothetical protein